MPSFSTETTTGTGWRWTKSDLRAAAVTIAVLAILGVLIAVLWWLIAPRAHVQIVASNQVVGVTPSESEKFVAADGWFLLLTGITGCLAGLIAWWFRSVRGPIMIVALVAGCLLGALIAAWLGGSLDGARPSGSLGDVVESPLQLSASAAVVAEPFLAVLAYLTAVVIFSRPDLGRRI